MLTRILDGSIEGREDLADLPLTLEEAIAGFKKDTVAQSWFDSLLVETHLAIRNAELRALSDLNDDEKCRRYALVY